MIIMCEVEVGTSLMDDLLVTDVEVLLLLMNRLIDQRTEVAS